MKQTHLDLGCISMKFPFLVSGFIGIDRQVSGVSSRLRSALGLLTEIIEAETGVIVTVVMALGVLPTDTVLSGESWQAWKSSLCQSSCRLRFSTISTIWPAIWIFSSPSSSVRIKERWMQ
uniref:Uncharacterized protein n=1 Tax=Cyprinus carpio TaxID=7962 RepID=A0A8C1UVF4_CYPCA